MVCSTHSLVPIMYISNVPYTLPSLHCGGWEGELEGWGWEGELEGWGWEGELEGWGWEMGAGGFGVGGELEGLGWEGRQDKPCPPSNCVSSLITHCISSTINSSTTPCRHPVNPTTCVNPTTTNRLHNNQLLGNPLLPLQPLNLHNPLWPP